MVVTLQRRVATLVTEVVALGGQVAWARAWARKPFITRLMAAGSCWSRTGGWDVTTGIDLFAPFINVLLNLGHADPIDLEVIKGTS